MFRKKCQFEDVKNIASTNNTSAFVAAVNKKDDHKWNGTRADARSDSAAADNRSSRIIPGADYKDIDKKRTMKVIITKDSKEVITIII